MSELELEAALFPNDPKLARVPARNLLTFSHRRLGSAARQGAPEKLE